MKALLCPICDQEIADPSVPWEGAPGTLAHAGCAADRLHERERDRDPDHDDAAYAAWLDGES